MTEMTLTYLHSPRGLLTASSVTSPPPSSSSPPVVLVLVRLLPLHQGLQHLQSWGHLARSQDRGPLSIFDCEVSVVRESLGRSLVVHRRLVLPPHRPPLFRCRPRHPQSVPESSSNVYLPSPSWVRWVDDTFVVAGGASSTYLSRTASTSLHSICSHRKVFWTRTKKSKGWKKTPTACRAEFQMAVAIVRSLFALPCPLTPTINNIAAA